MNHLAKLSALCALTVLFGSSAWGQIRTVSLAGNGPKYGSPVIAEVDGNTGNGKEIVVASANGIVSAISANGDILWETSLPIAECTALSGSNKVLSTPAVGDLMGDGIPSVVVSYGGIGGKTCPGGALALKGSDGTLQWNFDLKRLATRIPIFSVSHAAISSPALHDFTGDGKLEVVFGSLDRNIYMLTPRGRLKGYYHAADTVFSSPGIVQADGVGSAEIIIGTDISQNLQLKPPTPNGGYLYALRGSYFKGAKEIAFRLAGSAVWRAKFDQVVQASPTVGELISSNPGLEVVSATGCYFPEDSADKRGRYMKIFSLRTGRLLQTVTLPTCTNSEAAIADVDLDGKNDVIIPVQTLEHYGGSGPSKVIAYNPETSTTLWTTVPKVGRRNLRELALFSGVVVADLDKNGSREVIVMVSTGISILAGATGEHLTCDESDCTDGRQRLTVFSSARNAAAVDDLDGDGDLELVAAGPSGDGGIVKIYSDLNQLIASSPGTSTNYLPWPMVRGDAQHRGVQDDS